MPHTLFVGVPVNDYSCVMSCYHSEQQDNDLKRKENQFWQYYNLGTIIC